MRTNLQLTRKGNSRYILVEVTFSSARNNYLALEIYPSDIEKNSRLKVQAHKDVVKCLMFLLYAGYKRENHDINEVRLELSSDLNYISEIFNLENYTIIGNTRNANVVTKAKIQEYARKWDDIRFTFRVMSYAAQDSKMWVYFYLTSDLDSF